METVAIEEQKDIPLAAFDLFANETPEIKLEEVIPNPLPEVKVDPIAPFDISAFLLAARALPDVKVVAKPPFSDEGIWQIDIHNSARWVLATFSDLQTFIQIEHFMTFNPLGGTWTVLNNKELTFDAIDSAIVAIKMILEP